MNKEELSKIEELTLYINMELNILHNALKCSDETLDISAVDYFVENIYNKSIDIRNLF